MLLRSAHSRVSSRLLVLLVLAFAPAPLFAGDARPAPTWTSAEPQRSKLRDITPLVVDEPEKAWKALHNPYLFPLEQRTGTWQYWARTCNRILLDQAVPFQRRTPLEKGEISITGVKNVTWAAFGAKGEIYVSAQDSHEVRVWEDGKIRILPLEAGKDAGLRPIAISADRRTLAAACWDNTVRIWDLPAGKPRFTLTEPKSPGTAVALSADGRTLVTAAEDGYVRLWDATTGKLRRKLEPEHPDVRALALTSDGKTVISATRTVSVYLWDAETGKKSGQWEQPVNAPELAFSPSGGHLALRMPEGVTRILESASGKELPGSPTGKGFYTPTFTPDGTGLAGNGMTDSLARFWNLREGKIDLELKGGRPTILDFSPDGRTFLTCTQGGEIRLWDFRHFEGVVLPGHEAAVRALAWGPKGLLVSGSADATVRVWDVTTGRQRAVLLNHRASVMAVALDATGALLLSGGADRTLRLWDMTTLRQKAAFPVQAASITGVHFGKDGTAASGSLDGAIHLWDSAEKKQLGVLCGELGACETLAGSLDGKQLAAGGWDGTIRLWDVASRKEAAKLTGHKDGVTALAFQPQGEKLASASADGTVRLWNPATRQEEAVLKGPEGAVRAVAFSPNGKTLATGGADGVVRLWSVAARKVTREFRGHFGAITALAFEPTGQRLASGSADTNLRLWSVPQP